jgi:hypothetical protein
VLSAEVNVQGFLQRGLRLGTEGGIPSGTLGQLKKGITIDCIDLRVWSNGRFRLSRDEGVDSRLDPWGWQIRCKFGLIYPHGGDRLAVECDYHPQLAKRLAALGLEHTPGWRRGTYLRLPSGSVRRCSGDCTAVQTATAHGGAEGVSGLGVGEEKGAEGVKRRAVKLAVRKQAEV